MNYLEYARERLGKNWVLARRTPNIVARYDGDVVCVSKQRLAAVDKEYRAIYGDPYDKVRAEMYLALVNAKEELEIFDRQGGNAYPLVCAAITAELERK